jgi:hypothetical protein
MNIRFLSWNRYVLGLRHWRLKLNSPNKLWQIIHVFSFLYERDEALIHEILPDLPTKTN